jgi:hypothetical protein
MIMKKYLFPAALVAMLFTACQTEEPSAPPSEPTETTVHLKADTTLLEHVMITFNCRGFDISSEPFGTRSLTADGKTMTDLWVLDYPNDATAPTIQLHQVSTDDDFGSPTLNLAVGSHHVYFIASRGSGAAIDTDAHTLTFSKVLDTFYKDYEINVTATSNGSRSVTLERIVTKFTTVIIDAIPEGAATFNMTPAQWYYGWDYVAGTPTAATASQTITINIPASEIGVTNEPLNIFGFSAADEWTTDILLDCKKADGTILGTATIADIPLKQNRITTFSGPLFSAEGLTTVSLSTDWDTEHTGTW